MSTPVKSNICPKTQADTAALVTNKALCQGIPFGSTKESSLGACVKPELSASVQPVAKTDCFLIDYPYCYYPMTGPFHIDLVTKNPVRAVVQVNDSSTSAPIFDAQVDLVQDGVTVATAYTCWNIVGSSGYCYFDVNPSTYAVNVSATGYQSNSIVIALGANSLYTVTLNPISPPLPPTSYSCSPYAKWDLTHYMINGADFAHLIDSVKIDMPVLSNKQKFGFKPCYSTGLLQIGYFPSAIPLCMGYVMTFETNTYALGYEWYLSQVYPHLDPPILDRSIVFTFVNSVSGGNCTFWSSKVNPFGYSEVHTDFPIGSDLYLNFWLGINVQATYPHSFSSYLEEFETFPNTSQLLSGWVKELILSVSQYKE